MFVQLQIDSPNAERYESEDLRTSSPRAKSPHLMALWFSIRRYSRSVTPGSAADRSATRHLALYPLRITQRFIASDPY